MNEQNRFAGTRSRQVAYFRPYKGHIHNPGMGIISMAISDHMVTGYTKEDWDRADANQPFTLTKELLNEVTALSYIDNLYIRVGWNDVQKESGKLSLIPEFEMAVEAAHEAGISWGLRVMQCSPSNPYEHTVPEFLADRLSMYSYRNGCSYGPQPRKLPLYTDDYLKYWEEMLLMLGEKYDADPALEYADLSGYGLWGEGHHGCQDPEQDGVTDLVLDTPKRTEEVIRRLAEAHKKAFAQTPMVCNLVWSKYQAVQQAIREGSWVRRDSYYNWFEAAEAEYGLMKRPDAAMIYETVMPGVDMVYSEDPAFCHSYQELPERVCAYGAAYGIVGFNPKDTLFADRMMPQLFDAYKNKLGYRIYPSIIWYVEHEDGSRSLALGMVNDGSANPPGTLRIYAQTGGQETSAEVNGGLLNGRMYLAELPLAKTEDQMVTLRMELTMGAKTHTVRFAADTGEKEAPFELTIRLNHE